MDGNMAYTQTAALAITLLSLVSFVNGLTTCYMVDIQYRYIAVFSVSE